jgi:LacI family transcriptional regulator
MRVKKENVTISDLAKALGTSASTVSRALNDHPKISQATKERVKKVALSMGYVHSIKAAIQNNFSSNTIGIIVPSFSQKKYNILVESARKVLESAGYNVIISCTSEQSRQDENLVQLFKSLNLLGIIGSFNFKEKNPAYLQSFLKEKPLVLFDRISFELQCGKVMIDHFQAGFRAVQHLLNNGCRSIAHLGGNINCPLIKQISTGYKTAMRNGGIAVNKKLEVFSDFLLEDVLKATEIIFFQKEKPDGILVDDILSAQKLISILQNRKIRVPEDVAVIAISDECDYSYFTPSITTIQFSYSDLGQKAASILLKQLSDESYIPNNEVIVEPFNLNIRNSTLKR